MSFSKMIQRGLSWIAPYLSVPGLGFTGSSEGSLTTYIAPFFPPSAPLPKPLAQSAKAWRLEAQSGSDLQQESMTFMVFFRGYWLYLGVEVCNDVSFGFGFMCILWAS